LKRTDLAKLLKEMLQISSTSPEI